MKNKYLRAVIFIISLYCLSFALVSAFKLYVNKEYISTDNYFKSSNFSHALDDYMDTVVNYITNYKDFEKKTDSEKVSADEVNRAMSDNRTNLENEEDLINNQYDYQINDAIHKGNKDIADNYSKEKNSKLEEAKNKYDKTEAQVIKELAAEKDAQYKKVKDYIDNEHDMMYYLIDKNNQIYTNVSNITNIKEYIDSKALFTLQVPSDNKSDITENQELFYGYNRINNNGFRGYIVILKEDIGYGSIYFEMHEYDKMRNSFIANLVSAIILLSVSITLYAIMRKSKQDFSIIRIAAGLYSKIPVEFRIVLFIIISVFEVGFIKSNRTIKLLEINSIYFAVVFIITLYVLYFTISIRNVVEFISDNEKRHIQLKRSIVLKFSELIKESTIIKRVAVKVLIIMILTVLFGISLGMFLLYYSDDVRVCALVYCILYLACVPAYVIIKTTYLNKIILGTEKISGGDLNYVLPERGKNIFSKFAYNINNMKDGFKVALQNEIKSERLKTELITNVSHDLKTPLTSIVSYINLLKNGELSKEEAKDYVEILDRKAQKLKILIEDLFEASKMTSGSVELNIEKVDIVALLKQTLGEYDEKISKSNLQFKVNILSSNIYSMLDGKKTWRVFDNLINNILKYSQQNTRVYINVEEEPDKVKIIMKNISSYEMDFAPEEIFERFKRGDKARTTEGSGLGLAIAKSIVELQGGKLNIEIDGDLFKATVEFVKV